MTAQNYLMIQNGVVTNNVVWDGGSDWAPPADAIMLIQADTLAIIWVGTSVEDLPPTIPPTFTITYNLQEVMGAGDIGFVWDGRVLNTNQPQPAAFHTPVVGLKPA